ncbi:hypothetical protein NM208_g17071 [Fusarium decemcellulare]|uniref:Uncharacterized protein n=1 Tax=Fusarium decemcellulare TaxID=57161 RepID=A0ACC1RBS9_9HYPO|nr:hypothetical protein NM208_g17071 [Fusarium decemcellulare]
MDNRWGHERFRSGRRPNKLFQRRAEPRLNVGPLTRKPSSSRPFRQFLHQVQLERKWIKDELDFRHPGHNRDLDNLAYDSVRSNWENDGIWNLAWDMLPGKSWKHEELDPAEASSDGDSSSDEGTDATRQSKRGTKSPFRRSNYRSKRRRDDSSLGEEDLATQSENTRESSITGFSTLSEFFNHPQRPQLKRKPRQGAGKEEMIDTEEMILVNSKAQEGFVPAAAFGQNGGLLALEANVSAQGDSSSTADFEKTLSTLSTKITDTQASLDKLRSSSRRAQVLWTLYLSFAYLVYAIVLLLVVGYKNLGAYEWTGLSGGPVL